jgi:hypothetical protein
MLTFISDAVAKHLSFFSLFIELSHGILHLSLLFFTVLVMRLFVELRELCGCCHCSCDMFRRETSGK